MLNINFKIYFLKLKKFDIERYFADNKTISVFISFLYKFEIIVLIIIVHFFLNLKNLFLRSAFKRNLI